MQSASFLSFQRRLEQGHGDSNCQTLFGIEKIPTDNHIRMLLDEVAAESLQPCFDQALRPVYLGDALCCCQPVAEAVLETGADFLFVCKPEGHKTLYEFLQGARLEERMAVQRRSGKRSLTYRYRWIEGVPLRDGKDALQVNWIGVAIVDANGKTTYSGAFATSLAVTRDNVEEIATCVRARWKIENEGFNALKNNGYNLAHTFGHGKKHLAATFVAMNLFAFAFHTASDCLETLWTQAREAIGARARFFRDLHTITAYLPFQNWTALFNTLRQGKAPPTQNCC
jgi:hypothetical protein